MTTFKRLLSSPVCKAVLRVSNVVGALVNISEDALSEQAAH